ncbi:MAG TPA: choice-of-anchor J domain-containing protein, partial [Burkholderiaceae bacterium]|nr:choice-of-anchor J domain-containing protein [Burkholderiaceae bacterium]
AAFTEVWTTASVTSAWVETVVNLNAYAGQQIYVAFRYEGSDAHGWYVDDVTVDYEPAQFPVITVNPASLSKEVEQGLTASQTLTVGNTGNTALDYNVAIQYVTSKSTPDVTTKPIYGSGPAVEEMATEQGNALPAPQGVKHMTGSGTRAILFDNGPFVNNPGAGPGGSDLSQLHSGMTTFGPSINHGGSISVADDFTVTGNPWNIESFTFYAYQTNANNPTPPVSTITSGRLRIWDGSPANPGSQVIYGDMATDVMTSTYWTNAYRVSETAINNQRAIMAIVCSTPGLTLQPGEYWVEWAATGSIASGPWGVPVTINGQTTTGNAIQQTTTSGGFVPLLMGGTNTPYGL